MSSNPKWADVCEAESTLVLEATDFCCESSPSGSSPIDDYYAYVGDLMTLGDEASLASSEVLGRLLLLGLVSGVEQYFRAVIAGTLRICPVSRSVAADQVIHFGALDHYGPEGIEAALFDATSLADAEAIKKRTASLLGVQIKAGTSLNAALLEFDKVCVMRHAAVHSRGTLGRGNVRDLGFSTGEGTTHELQLSFSSLQQAGAACHGVVRAYNRFLFRQLLERWASNKSLSWNWVTDRDRFTGLVHLFESDTDRSRPSTTYARYRSLRSAFSAEST